MPEKPDAELDQLINANLERFKNQDWHLRLKKEATVFDTINWCIALARKTVNQQAVQQAINYAASDGANLERFCRRLFDYVAKHIEYVNDPDGREFVVTPDRLMREGKGDCKKMTTFIAACCMKAGIPVLFKVVRYGSFWEHIYPIIPLADGRYITMDVVNDKKYNSEVEYKGAMLFDINANQMELNALGNIPKFAADYTYGTQAAQAVAGWRNGHWQASSDPYCQPMGNPCEQILGHCDRVSQLIFRPGYAVGPMGSLGALVKLGYDRWQTAAKNGDNWGFLLPIFFDYNSLSPRLQKKWNELKTYIMNNTKKDHSFTGVRAAIDRGIMEKFGGKSAYQILKEMQASMAQVRGIGQEAETKTDDTGAAQVDAIKNSEWGKKIDGFIANAKNWIANLFIDASTSEGNMQQVHPQLVWTIPDYAEALGVGIRKIFPNLVQVGAGAAARYYFKGSDGKYHEFPTHPDPIRTSARNVTYLADIGKQLGFDPLNFDMKSNVSPVGDPIPDKNVAAAVNFINQLGGIQEPLSPGLTLPPDLNPTPNAPGDQNKPQPKPGEGAGAAALAIPLIAAFALLS